MNIISLVKWIKQLIKDDDLWKFYKSSQWLELRAEVLHEQHNECQYCLQKIPKKITRAVTVHHEQEVRQHPALALSKYYTDDKGQQQRQLNSICKDCHNRVHKRFGYEEKKYITEERW